MSSANSPTPSKNQREKKKCDNCGTVTSAWVFVKRDNDEDDEIYCESCALDEGIICIDEFADVPKPKEPFIFR